MYEVKHFVQEDVSVLRNYVVENPFATLVVGAPEGPSADHLPFELHEPVDAPRFLLGHIARSNPLWQRFESGPALVMSCSHQAYVSPDWYTSKASEPRVLPTWNYTAVHVTGTLSFFDDPQRIHRLLERLTNRFESSRPTPWRIDDAPADFVSKMITGVVGVELEIEKIVGKWKMSQNRSLEDRKGVMAGLRREGFESGVALASLMDDEIRDLDE